MMVGNFTQSTFWYGKIQAHPSILGALSLSMLHLSLYGLLYAQQSHPFLLLSFSLLGILSLAAWLSTLPYALIATQRTYQLIAAVSLVLGFLPLVPIGFLSRFIPVLAASWHHLNPEMLFFFSALASSGLSVGLITAGQELIRQYAHLNEQKGHCKTLIEQHALIREVLDVIHHTQSQDELCKQVLKAVLEITRAESACIIPYHAKTKTFGAPIASLPESVTADSEGIVTQIYTDYEDASRQGFALPIQFQSEPVAFLMIHHPEPLPRTSPKRSLLYALCRQTAIALNRLCELEQPVKDSPLQLTETLADNLELGVFATGKTGELVFINSTAETLLGWCSADRNSTVLKNKPFLSIIQPPNVNNGHEEEHFISKDGEALPVFCTSTAIPLNAQEQGTVYVFHDLSRQKQSETELKQYAQHLKQSNRKLEQFAYLAAHDLQAPLIKLQHFSGMLSKNTSGTESQEIARRIQHSTHYMHEMVQSILLLAQVSTQKPTFEPVDLKQLVQQVLQEHKEKIRHLKARVHIGQMAVVDGSPALLRILLHNLVGNALKFHRPGTPPQIFISCQNPSENLCQISIQDNGIGFPSHQAEQIFKMFERMHGNQEYPGYGIGLALCKRVVEQHSGDMSAYGAINQGATFTISLPIKQHA